MALSLPTSSDYVKRLTNIVQPNSSYTCIFWVTTGAISVSPAYQTFFALIDDPAIYNYFAGIFANTVNIDLNIGDGVSAPVVNFPSVPTVNKWYPITYVRAANVHSLYIAGVFIGSTTLNISAGTFGFEALGNDTYSDGNLKIFSFKEWNTVLNFTQINQEINAPYNVVNTTNLVTFTPLTSDLLDVSGHGNDWIAVGSPSFVADPALPSNTSAATALDISAVSYPFAQTTNQFFDTYTFDLWLKATFNQFTELSVFPLGNIGSGYQPSASSYDNALTLQTFGDKNVPIQQAFEMGTQHYLRITPNANNPSPASLVLSIDKFVQSQVPSGSIAVNDDTDGYPLAIASRTVDAILKFVLPFPAGENATILSDGTLLVEDVGAGDCKLYDVNLVQLASVALTNISYIGYDNANTQFFVCYKNGSNHYVIQRVSKAGVIDGTIFDLGTSHIFNCVADSNFIYYQIVSNTTVKRWNISTNTAASDLIAGGAASVCKDIIILSDGTLIVGYPNNSNIKRYSNTGVLLNTYTPGFTGDNDDRMAPDINDAHFVYWSQNSVAPSVFYIIKTSDGTFTQKNQTVYESGTYEGTPISNPVRFGVSFSCPIWVTRRAKFGGLYQIVSGKINDTVVDSDSSHVDKMINWLFETTILRDL